MAVRTIDGRIRSAIAFHLFEGIGIEVGCLFVRASEAAVCLHNSWRDF